MMRPPPNATPATRLQHGWARWHIRVGLPAWLAAVALATMLAAAPVPALGAFEYSTGNAPSAQEPGAAGNDQPADAAPARPPHDCDAPPDIAPDQEPVASLAGALKEGPRALTIVVLGSLSAAPPPQVREIPGFPVRLQARLTEAFTARASDLSLRVETVGRTRAMAGELATLIKREVLPLNPTLVIWQVGRADARQANSPHRFSQSLKEGLDILQQAGIATILADIQFHPQFEALYRTDDYRHYVRWVAGKRDLPLLRRYEMIEHWASAGAIDLDSGDEAEQQAAYRFIQECLAYQATRMILGVTGLARRQ